MAGNSGWFGQQAAGGGHGRMLRARLIVVDTPRSASAWQARQLALVRAVCHSRSGLPPANDLRWKLSPRAAANPANAGASLLAVVAYSVTSSSRAEAVAVAVVAASTCAIAGASCGTVGWAWSSPRWLDMPPLCPAVAERLLKRVFMLRSAIPA